MKDVRKLSEIDAVIEKTIKLDIAYNASIENYTYNDYWVNEIQRTYFDKRITKLDKKIDKVIDPNDKGHIKYIRAVSKTIKTKLEELSKLKVDELKNIDHQKHGWDVYLNYPQNPPEKSSLELWLPQQETGADDRYEYILQIVGGFYDISFDEVATKSQKELNIYIHEKLDIQDNELQLAYAKAHLIFILNCHGWLLGQLLNKFLSIINLVNKLSEFEGEENEAVENESELSEILNILTNFNNFQKPIEDNNGNQKLVDITFKGYKYEIAMLFNFLHDYGYITGGNNPKTSLTNVKKFIDQSNIYFYKDELLEKVGNPNREFSKLSKHNLNMINNEIDFSEKLIENLEKRIEVLKKIE